MYPQPLPQHVFSRIPTKRRFIQSSSHCLSNSLSDIWERRLSSRPVRPVSPASDKNFRIKLEDVVVKTVPEFQLCRAAACALDRLLHIVPVRAIASNQAPAAWCLSASWRFRLREVGAFLGPQHRYPKLKTLLSRQLLGPMTR